MENIIDDVGKFEGVVMCFGPFSCMRSCVLESGAQIDAKMSVE